MVKQTNELCPCGVLTPLLCSVSASESEESEAREGVLKGQTCSDGVVSGMVRPPSRVVTHFVRDGYLRARLSPDT